jgi:hypothetical protein
MRFFLKRSPFQTKTHLCHPVIFSHLWPLLFKHWLIQGSPVILISYLCDFPFNRASSGLYFISNRFWKVWSTCIEIFRNLRMTGQPKGDQVVCPSAHQTEAAYPPLHVSARYTTTLYRKSDLWIPRNETGWPRSQFLHSFVCEGCIYYQDRSVYLAAAKLDRSILGI